MSLDFFYSCDKLTKKICKGGNPELVGWVSTCWHRTHSWLFKTFEEQRAWGKGFKGFKGNSFWWEVPLLWHWTTLSNHSKHVGKSFKGLQRKFLLVALNPLLAFSLMFSNRPGFVCSASFLNKRRSCTIYYCWDICTKALNLSKYDFQFRWREGRMMKRDRVCHLNKYNSSFQQIYFF